MLNRKCWNAGVLQVKRDAETMDPVRPDLTVTIHPQGNFEFGVLLPFFELLPVPDCRLCNNTGPQRQSLACRQTPLVTQSTALCSVQLDFCLLFLPVRPRSGHSLALQRGGPPVLGGDHRRTPKIPCALVCCHHVVGSKLWGLLRAKERPPVS